MQTEDIRQKDVKQGYLTEISELTERSMIEKSKQIERKQKRR